MAPRLIIIATTTQARIVIGAVSRSGLRREREAFAEEAQVLLPPSHPLPFRCSHTALPLGAYAPHPSTAQVAISLVDLDAAGGVQEEGWVALAPMAAADKAGGDAGDDDDARPGGIVGFGIGFARQMSPAGLLPSPATSVSAGQSAVTGGSFGTAKLRVRIKLGSAVLRPVETYDKLLNVACAAPATVAAILEACPASQRDAMAEGLLHAVNRQGALPC